MSLFFLLSEKTESNKVERVLKSLRLSDTIHTDPQRLSMGEQQRLNMIGWHHQLNGHESEKTPT